MPHQARLDMPTLARAVLSRLSALAVVVPDPALGHDRCLLPRPLARRLFAPRLAAGASLDEIAASSPVLIGRRRPRNLRQMAAFSFDLSGDGAVHLSPRSIQNIHTHPGALVQARAFLTREAGLDLLALRPSGGPSPDDGRLGVSLSPDARVGLAYLTAFVPGARGAAEAPADPRLPWPEGLGEEAGHLPLPGLPEGWARAGAAAARRLRAWQVARQGMLTGFFASAAEVDRALDAGELDTGALIFVREHGVHVATTPGRLLAAQALGLGAAASSDLRRFERRHLDEIAGRLDAMGIDPGAALARIEALGLEHATRSGLSLSADTLRPPPRKDAIQAELNARLSEVQVDHDEGLITGGERYIKVVDLWSDHCDRVSYEANSALVAGRDRPSWLLREAGLWGHQQRRLGACFGLLARPSGEIIERGILASLHEGLSPHEVFLAILAFRGTRLRKMGRRPARFYLWSTLIEALGPARVVADDCGAPGSIELHELPSSDPDFPMVSLAERAAGRVVVEPGGEPRGPLTEAEASALRGQGASAVRVRSPVTCEAEGGVCAACYGAGPGLRGLPEVGDAVGLWAAHAIASLAHRLPEEQCFCIGYGQVVWDFYSGFKALVRLLSDTEGEAGKIIARVGGVVSIEDDPGSGGKRVTITPRAPDGRQMPEWAVEHVVPRGHRAEVQGGELCEAGEEFAVGGEMRSRICPGLLSGVFAREEVARRLVDRLQLIFAYGGMKLDARHAEMVAREMLDFVKITGAGGGPWRPGERVRRGDFFATNEALERQGKEAARAEPTALGLGRVAARRAVSRP